MQFEIEMLYLQGNSCSPQYCSNQQKVLIRGKKLRHIVLFKPSNVALPTKHIGILDCNNDTEYAYTYHTRVNVKYLLRVVFAAKKIFLPES